MRSTFSTTKIAKALGSTYAKIKYLCETRLHIEPAQGSYYTAEDAARIVDHHRLEAEWHLQMAEGAKAQLFGKDM